MILILHRFFSRSVSKPAENLSVGDGVFRTENHVVSAAERSLSFAEKPERNKIDFSMSPQVYSVGLSVVGMGCRKRAEGSAE